MKHNVYNKVSEQSNKDINLKNNIVKIVCWLLKKTKTFLGIIKCKMSNSDFFPTYSNMTYCYPYSVANYLMYRHR